MTFSTYPITLVWDITYKCNFKCLHCYINDGKKRNELSSQKLENLIKEFANCGVFYIDIGGGEPIMRMNDLSNIIKIATIADIECTVATNGWYLSKENVIKLKNNGLKRILVSVDGSNEKIHDAFLPPESYLSMKVLP